MHSGHLTSIWLFQMVQNFTEETSFIISTMKGNFMDMVFLS